MRRLDLARDELDFTDWDGVFHLAGQPGVRSFGDVFPLYVERNVLASQRVFEAAAFAGARVVFASSSSIYGEAEQYPTPEESAAPALAVRDHEAGVRAPGASDPRGASGSTPSSSATSTPTAPGSDRTWRFHAVVEALIEGRPFTLYGDGEHRRSFTYVGDVVAASMRAMEEAGPGSTYNVGGGQEATMNETIEMLERSPGEAWTSSGARRSQATSVARRPIRRGSGKTWLAADNVPGRGPQIAMGVGGGRVARVNTPPDLDAAGTRPPLRLGADRRTLVVPVLGVVLGLVVGFALALGGGKVYEAETLVAMGQPFSPNGGAPVQSFLTNARAVSEIIRSECALKRAAHAADLPVRALRGNVSTPSSAHPARAPSRPARRS